MPSAPIAANPRCPRGSLGLLLGAWLWATSTCLAGAADLVTVKTNYYTVIGNTGPELRRSLAAARPWRAQSERDARTEWTLRYQYDAVRTPRGCRLGAVTVRTTVTLTLPRWRYTRPPSPELLHRWRPYLAGLMRHEKGHEQLGIEAGQELRRRLQALGELDCAELAHAVERINQAVETEFRQREAAYDKETQHGRTQGARW